MNNEIEEEVTKRYLILKEEMRKELDELKIKYKAAIELNRKSAALYLRYIQKLKENPQLKHIYINMGDSFDQILKDLDDSLFYDSVQEQLKDMGVK